MNSSGCSVNCLSQRQREEKRERAWVLGCLGVILPSIKCFMVFFNGIYATAQILSIKLKDVTVER